MAQYRGEVSETLHGLSCYAVHYKQVVIVNVTDCS